MKVCKVCGIEKPFEEYYKSRGLPVNKCKSCYIKNQIRSNKPKRPDKHIYHLHSKHIMKRGNKYVVQISVNGIKKRERFNNLSDAERFRDETLALRPSKNKKIAEVIEYYLESKSTNETCENFNISPQTVSAYYSKYLPYKGLEPVTITKQSKV